MNAPRKTGFQFKMIKKTIFPEFNQSVSSSFLIILNKLFPDSKHAQSQIVATVILILLVVTTSIIIIGFVVPFVNKQLSGVDCLDVIQEINIQNSDKYTCLNMISSSDNILNLQIHRGNINDIHGFSVEISGGSSSFTIQIVDGNFASDGISMFGKPDDLALELPGKNEERTYSINLSISPESVNVYPILIDGKTCSSADTLSTIVLCK